jgi:flagellar biosynthesis protein
MADKLAAAVRYDDRLPAPFVTASGRNHTAEKLLGLAREYGVPVVDSADLAERLIELDPFTMIPEHLFAPVAEVLSFVLRLDEDAGSRTQQSR